MNFGQERFQWLEQDPYTREKMPFYMTYPMQNTVFEETEYEKDCKRLQEMYPRDARRIQSMVDEECDRMEYEGSMMFDRYPDRLMMEMICRRIYRGLRPEDVEEDGRLHVDEKYFMLVQVMLMQEMYRRRCRHYRCRRWY